MSKRFLRPFAALAGAVVGVLALAGALVLASPPGALEAASPRQTTTITDTTGMTGTTEHDQHHPGTGAGADATVTVTATDAATATTGAPGMEMPGMTEMPGMMGMMMGMMAEMHGMMGQGMMGQGMMEGQGMMGSMPMSGTMPMPGMMGAPVDDCAMMGPMLSMAGSMLSMMGAMHTAHGMMQGHSGMADAAAMPGMDHGMMGSMPMSGTMPMSDTMRGPGMMGSGMMADADLVPMLDQAMAMMGQLRALAATCRPGAAGAPGAMGAANFDLTFIDSMIHHHEGAIAMAQQALTEAEHPELQAMAQAIIAAQDAEITQMQSWREAWYPGVAPSGGMGMEMGTMDVPAGDEPFDQRFIDAMLSHHRGALAMAQQVLTQGEHAELKELAQAIITAQEAEIAQLESWRSEWYPSAP